MLSFFFKKGTDVRSAATGTPAASQLWNKLWFLSVLSCSWVSPDLHPQFLCVALRKQPPPWLIPCFRRLWDRMGVQGLTTFVEGHRHFLQDVRFRDSRLVIDGCSLYFRLYFNHVLDQRHGGDYDTFACMLHQFLSALAACRIEPFVVLDGGKDALICFKKWISVCVVKVSSCLLLYHRINRKSREHVRVWQKRLLFHSLTWRPDFLKRKAKHLKYTFNHFRFFFLYTTDSFIQSFNVFYRFKCHPRFFERIFPEHFFFYFWGLKRGMECAHPQIEIWAGAD